MARDKGKITIVRTHCNNRDDFVSMEIVSLDRRRICDVDIKLAEFTEAITGLGDRPCMVTTRAIYPEPTELKQQLVTYKGEELDQAIMLIQEAKRELSMENGKPLIAIEALNAATDILGNPNA